MSYAEITKKQLSQNRPVAKPTCSIDVMNNATITVIVCPPLELLKPVSPQRQQTNDSASSANLLSDPSLCDSAPSSVCHQKTPAKAKPIEQVHLPITIQMSIHKTRKFNSSGSKHLYKLDLKAEDFFTTKKITQTT
ncbi:hypothetical protein CDAR_28891 [Caerostris darwini]|uniref:Uncharacterized protein n=1 Tax=Caerostris darwini TaxID=1538125 RepID=A0AAV4N826_9ARAC|nr:hypothetical protein CDAR_28891 [Caerostris darwini]